MKKNKYNRSFARKLTRWVMIVLFIMMGGLAFLVYDMARSIMVENSADSFYSSIQSYESSISGVMTEVSVAVENNVFDIERNVNQPRCKPSWSVS